MVDSHCHLDFCSEPEAAAANDLAAMITVGTTVARNRTALELADRLPKVFAAVGIHPNNASDAADPDARTAVEELARHPRAVAIGETGFDTHWEDESLQTQRAAFDWQADLARRLDLPLILHVRDRQSDDRASRAAVDALRDAGWNRGILHCFNGHHELLQTGLDLGWMVSFAGNLTYRSADALRAAAERVPLERLLVETDSPYLTPEPLRGRRNEPANVRHTATALAGVVGMDIADLEPILDRNAALVYKLDLERDAPAGAS